MDTIFGQRLRQARTMKRFSLRELAEVMGGKVSHNALARYERGEMMPGSNVLVALSEALAQPADFFFRPFKVELRDIRFRKKSRLGTGKANAAVEEAADFYERFREAEELSGGVQVFRPPLDSLKSLEKPEDAEVAAKQLRDVWQLGNDPIPSVIDLLESKGIKVFETKLDGDLDGFSAYANEDGIESPLVVVGKTEDLPRKRMTCVHEMAHVVLPLPDDEKLEEEIAKRFAGAFLLPEETFKEAFGTFRHRFGVSELIELKARFGVSILGIMKRAEQLGMISEDTFRGFCIYANKQKWRSKGEPVGNRQCSCCETPVRFQQLVWRAVSENQISLSKGAALLKLDVDTFRRQLEEVIG